MKAEESGGGDAETVRLVGRARKLIRVGTIKNPDGYEGSGRLGTPEVGAGSLRKLAMMSGFTPIPDSRRTRVIRYRNTMCALRPFSPDSDHIADSCHLLTNE